MNDQTATANQRMGSLLNETVKDAAKRTLSTYQDHRNRYGDDKALFERIARRWELHLFNRHGSRVALDARDVAMMRLDLEIARLESAPADAEAWTAVGANALAGAGLPEGS